METVSSLRAERSALARRLLRYREMLPGSFSERRLTCGKPGCVCMREGKRHQAYQLTYRLQGKTFTKMIPRAQADDVRKKVALQKEFYGLVKRIQAINMRLYLEALAGRE